MVQPPAAATILRELHETPATASGTASPLQIGFAYSDGTGREVQRKKLAEPRHPAGDGTAVPQWLCSGWVIVNNKGKPVRQYEPVFRPKHLFEFAVKEGVSPILCYDPAGRVVATLHPNHTYDKVVFTAWQQQTWDVNDTAGLPAPDGLPAGNPADDPDVRGFTTALPDDEYLPTWYQRRTQPGPDRLDVFGPLAPHEKTAAARTTKHAATPTNAHLDPLGRPVLTIAHDRAPLMTDSASKDLPWDQLIWADTHHRTHTVLDITGNQLQVDDCTDGKPGRLDGAKDRIVAQYVHDLVGSRLAEHSMEAGSRRHLADITGRPVAIWELLDDGTYRRLTTAYDKLRRPTDTVLQDTTGEKTVTRTVYGEDAPDAVANNVRGQAWKIYDGAGIVTHTYDIQGNPATTGRELAAAYRTVLDWSATPAPAVEDRTWTAATSFDALDRPTERTHPDGTVVRFGYNRTGLRARVWGRIPGETEDTDFVTDIAYNAREQRTRIDYGNGVRTEYGYETDTFRLRSSLRTRRRPGPGDAARPGQLLEPRQGRAPGRHTALLRPGRDATPVHRDGPTPDRDHAEFLAGRNRSCGSPGAGTQRRVHVHPSRALLQPRLPRSLPPSDPWRAADVPLRHRPLHECRRNAAAAEQQPADHARP